MGARAWSRATPEQRERHRQACLVAAAARFGRQRWLEAHEGVLEKCDLAREKGVDVEAVLRETVNRLRQSGPKGIEIGK